MSFQDFGPLSDRLKADKQKKKRKKIVLVFCTFTVFVGLIFFAVRGVLRYQRMNGSSSSSNSHGSSTYDVKTVIKSITTICSPTDYKKLCEIRLMRAARRSKTRTKPKDLIDKAIAIVRDEISRTMNRTRLIKSNDPNIHGAVDDCEELFTDAMDDLHDTMRTVRRVDLDQFPLTAPEIKNSLSAVMTYQQTCVDGFPDVDSRIKMDNEIKIGRQLTSNALAIATGSTAILSIFSAREIGLGQRRLLEQIQNGTPRWIAPEERKLLTSKGRKTLKPDVVVSKDGTGKFQTITEALTAMPKKHDGRRYFIYVKSGIYNECPVINRMMRNVTMYGDGSRKTIVTGSKNFADGVRTFHTATFGEYRRSSS